MDPNSEKHFDYEGIFVLIFLFLHLIEGAVEAGVTFDNSFFDNCFVFLRQCKDRSYLGTFTLHKKVEIRINRSQILSCFTSINVFFDFFPTLYWSKENINRSKTGEDLTSINSYFDFWVRLG